MNDKKNILNEIIEIERKEKNGIDEQLYIRKIELLCILADIDVQKVWAEYSIVQQITKQAVLMNKAMSIPLTKNEVSSLIDDLNKKYQVKLKAEKIQNVNLVFSTTIRGHAKEVSKEIVLPKLGDWRFGYKNLYSAELIFHEFAHLLDYGRIKNQKYGKNDIHKHDFVRILDGILLDYSSWIDSRYIPIRQREQILNNSKLIVDFHVNRQEIEEQDKNRELKEIEEKKIISQKLNSEAGVSDDSFPIHLLLADNEDVKKNYLDFSIDYYIKNTPVSLQLKKEVNELNDVFKLEKPILNKNQIELLVKTLSKSKINDYLLKLPLMQQLKMSSVLKKFNDDINSLSIGKISMLDNKEIYKVRTYEDSDFLKKRGLED
jgi:hypothetical protein